MKKLLLLFIILNLIISPATAIEDDNTIDIIHKENSYLGNFGKITPVSVSLIKSKSEKVSILAQEEILEERSIETSESFKKLDKKEYAPNEILLKSRKLVPEKGIKKDTKDKIKSRAPKKTHVLLQFDNIPSKEEKEELEKEGIELLSYIPNKAWFASVPSDISDKIIDFPNIRVITEILTEDKISPAVRNKNYIINEDGTVNLSIKFFNDVDLDDASSIIENYGEVIDMFSSVNSIKFITEESFILYIAEEEDVQWIDVIEKILEMHNDGNRENIGVNTLQASPYDLSGNGVVTAEWDGGWADTTHDDLQGRVTIGDTGSSTGDHATHVAGTMLGNGTLSETEGGTALQWRGMAPQATVISYEWWDDSAELNNEYDSAINTYDSSLSQNSWGYTYFGCGSDCSGGYDSNAAELDGIVRGSKGKRISQIWSSGNKRGYGTCDNGEYDCIGLPGTAKNIITVGATNSNDDSMTSFSSWGPTNDGRLKPEVTAPGCQVGGDGGIKSTIPEGSIDYTYPYDTMCGTSMAAPTTSGVIALLYEEFSNKGVYPLPSTIKAILIHTAKDLGNTGPDYSFGYGRINATASIDKIKDDTGANDVIKEESISNGEVKEFNMTVASTIKVTLVWDDYPATANADPTLVNDLDLVLIAPNSSLYYPWILDPNNPGNSATTGTNTIDNVEQVYVAAGQIGIWTVRVNGSSIPNGPQNFSLVSDHSFTIQPTVTVKTFRDAYTTEDKFFDIDDGVYVQANVTVGGDPSEGNIVTADLILSNGTLEDSLILNEVSNGIYRNSWGSTGRTTGVYLINVTVSGNVTGEGNNSFHLYSGENVSAYRMGWGNDNNKDYVLENLHLIAVFDGENATDQSLLYLEQKDTNVSYNFASISDSNTIGRGEVTTTNLKGLKFYSFLFSQEGEGLSSVILGINTEISDPTEQMITYYDTSNGASYDTKAYIDDDQWIGERFNPADLDTDYTLTKVSVYVDKGARASNPLIVEIRTDSSGSPSNTVLTSESIVASSVPVSPGWVDVTFASQITLEQGGLYWLVLRNIDSRAGPNYAYTWTGDDTSPSYPGAMAFSQNQGSSWNDGSASYDMVFRAWGYPAAITTIFNLSISMNSEDVDYLIYTLNNFDNNIANMTDLVAPISGNFGSIEDDRYHLQTGEDELITSLPQNQWSNFSSNYTAIYDNSSSDGINENVLAFVRFNESAGVSFQDVGLWNGSEGLRIRYNVTEATTNDGITYILTFTKGDWQTIDQWMPTIASNQFPLPNFLTPPSEEVAPQLKITEVYYDTVFSGSEPDEYVRICNPTEDNVSLDGWTINDNYDTSAFPNGYNITKGSCINIARNGTAFELGAGEKADFEMVSTDVAVPDMTGGLALANTGDEVILNDSSDNVIDAFVYGSSSYSGDGWTGDPVNLTDTQQFQAGYTTNFFLVRNRKRDEFNEGQYKDTDSADDWDNNRMQDYVRYIGQSRFDYPRYFNHTGNITLFASPDTAYQEIIDFIDSANSSLYVSLYDWNNFHIMDHIVNASLRGIDVKVLLDGDTNNFSGVTDDNKYIAKQINDSGGKVAWMVDQALNSDVRNRYASMHAKYAVADNKNILVLSDNWKYSGVAVDPSTGNRDWHIIIWNNTNLADYFTAVFNDDYDLAHKDIVEYCDLPEWCEPAGGFTPNRTVETGNYTYPFTSEDLAVSDMPIQAILSPDTSMFANKSIIGMLKSANNGSKVYWDEFYAWACWGIPKASCNATLGEKPNVYLEEAIEAARRGATVKILLDSTDYNIDGTNENQDTVAYVNDIAANESLDLEARLANYSITNYTKIHNKGMIVDDKVLISSINVNFHSTHLNREEGIIITSQNVSDYFEEIFWYDWNATMPPLPEFISITLLGFPIDFGSLDQNTQDSPASGNVNNSYIIRIDNTTTINTDIYQKGDDFTTNGYTLAIENMSWNTVNNVTTSTNMTNNYQNNVTTNVTPGTDINMYYWIDIPSQMAGTYTATIYIKAVETGTLP